MEVNKNQRTNSVLTKDNVSTLKPERFFGKKSCKNMHGIGIVCMIIHFIFFQVTCTVHWTILDEGILLENYRRWRSNRALPVKLKGDLASRVD